MGGSNSVWSSRRSPQEHWPRVVRVREHGQDAESNPFNIYLSILVFPGYCLLVFLFQFKVVKLIISLRNHERWKEKEKNVSVPSWKTLNVWILICLSFCYLVQTTQKPLFCLTGRARFCLRALESSGIGVRRTEGDSIEHYLWICVTYITSFVFNVCA